VRGAVKITRRHGKSTYETIIRVASGSAGDRIEFINHVDWAEKETLLKAAFKLSARTTASPTILDSARSNAVSTRRKNTKSRTYWADQTSRDGSYGVAVLNDCKYGWDHPDDRTLRLTLIHTPGVFDSWNWVGDQAHGYRATYVHVCRHGTREFGWELRRALAGGAAQSTDAGVRSASASGKAGEELLAASDLQGKPGDDHAVKMAENSDELVIRVRELQGRRADGVTISFGKPVVSAREVNGQEEEIGAASAERTADLLAHALSAESVCGCGSGPRG